MSIIEVCFFLLVYSKKLRIFFQKQKNILKCLCPSVGPHATSKKIHTIRFVGTNSLHFGVKLMALTPLPEKSKRYVLLLHKFPTFCGKLMNILLVYSNYCTVIVSFKQFIEFLNLWEISFKLRW